MEDNYVHRNFRCLPRYPVKELNESDQAAIETDAYALAVDNGNKTAPNPGLTACEFCYNYSGLHEDTRRRLHASAGNIFPLFVAPGLTSIPPSKLDLYTLGLASVFTLTRYQLYTVHYSQRLG